MIELSGGEAVVRTLIRNKIRYIFGMPGGQLLPMYDAIYEYRPRINHVLVRDERCGAFMADAYARASNEIAACDGIVGPGVTNLVSGVAEAYYASIPMLVVISDIDSQKTGKGASQECDQLPIFKPITKEIFYINSVERIPEILNRGISAIKSGTPGPVLVDIPEDICYGKAKFDEMVFESCDNDGKKLSRPSKEDIQRAFNILMGAKRPVITAGGGVHLSEAWEPLIKFAERLSIPIATTVSGKGSIDERHPLSLGLEGLFSTKGTNDFIRQADVLLVVGCRLGGFSTSNWSLIPKESKIIQIDSNPYQLGKNYPLAVGLYGDAKLALEGLIEVSKGIKPKKDIDLKKRIKRMIQERESVNLLKGLDKESTISILMVLNELRRNLPDDSILITGGGLVTQWAAVHYQIRKAGRTHIANRGQATIGYGLPALIGVKLAVPGKVVASLDGDGGFGQSIMELETAARIKIAPLVVVINNGTLGWIKGHQYQSYGSRFISVDMEDVNYANIAKEMGCESSQIIDTNQLHNEVKKAVDFVKLPNANRPYLLDVKTRFDPEEPFPGSATV